MKHRVFKSVCILLLVSVSVCALSSCSLLLKMDHLLLDPATRSFVEASLNMADVSSYSTETTLSFSGQVMGSELEADLRSTTLYYDQFGDEFIQHTETQSSVKVDGISQGTIVSYNGFRDGKMYTAYKESGQYRQKLYSAISKEDFLSHEEEMSLRTQSTYTFLDTQTKGFVEQNDGSTVATFTDFRQEVIDDLMLLTGGIEELFYGEYRATALTVTFKATPDALPASLTYVFTCAKTELSTSPNADAPIITMTTVFKDLNTLETPEEFSLSSFTQVQDLRILDHLSYALDDRIEATEGAYRLELNQTVITDDLTQEYHEVDEGRFSTVNGRPTFHIEADADGTQIECTYSNGVQTTVMRDENGTETTTANITDAEARMFIAQQLNPGQLATYYVTKMETVDSNAGIYRLTVANPDLTSLENILATATRPAETTCTYTATYRNGVLTECFYELSVQAQTSRYGAVTVNMSARSTYIDTEQNDTAD